jgi:hypothetical protein
MEMINACSEIKDYKDTLVVGNHTLFLISLISPKINSGSLEVIDKNKKHINDSTFSINMVQVKNGDNCWETSSISKAIGTDSASYNGIYYNMPAWSFDPKTKIIIQLTISGDQYSLIDEHVNN